jgi:curved DNA-binding protein
MNYYEILDIPVSATLDDIKRAYRKKAMKYHPDRGGNVQQFQEILTAYNELSNIYNKPQFEFNLSDDYDDDDFDMFVPELSNQDLKINVHISLDQSYIGDTIEARYELLSGKFQTVELDFPAGIRHGQTVQYVGFGDDSVPLIPRGNLIVTYIVDIHNSFIRRKDDICTVININPIEAMIGCKKIIKNIDETEYTLSIKPGTQPNHELIIHNSGFLNLSNNKRGNFIIIVSIDIPEVTNDKIIKKLSRLSKDLYS